MPTCPICQKWCASDSGLMSHTEAKHGSGNVHRGVVAWENGRGQRNLMTTGAEVADGKIEVGSECFNGYNWECPMCSRTFSNRNGLSCHVNSGVHSEKAYQCDDCGRKFAKMAQLVSHTSNSSCRHAAHAAETLVHDYQRGPERLMLMDSEREPTYEATLYFDGSAVPNPGNGGAGFILYGVHSNELSSGSYEIQDYPCTNNEAEWISLVLGLQEALRYNIRTLRIHGDSELVLKQMQGHNNVNSLNLKKYFDKAKALQGEFMRCSFEHVKRSLNSVADRLADDGRQGCGSVCSKAECQSLWDYGYDYGCDSDSY